MKVTGIDIHRVTLPYDEAGLTRRTIYVARTDIVVCRYESGLHGPARLEPQLDAHELRGVPGRPSAGMTTAHPASAP